MVTSAKARRHLQQAAKLEAIAKYWQGYASADEAETTQLRRWSTETLGRGMVTRAIALCQALARSEDSISTLPGEPIRRSGVVRAEEHLLWKGIRVAIIGIEDADGGLPSTLSGQLQEASRDSLTLCVLPTAYIDTWQEVASSARQAGGFVLPVFPNDVN